MEKQIEKQIVTDTQSTPFHSRPASPLLGQRRRRERLVSNNNP